MFRVYVSILVLGYFVSPLIELATKTSALKRTNYKANWGTTVNRKQQRYFKISILVVLYPVNPNSHKSVLDSA
jgi:hypothetical protein